MRNERDELDTYRRSIGVLFQSGGTVQLHDRGRQRRPAAAGAHRLPEHTIGIMVKIKLELVGLREHADKMPAQLSGGMKKRAGLAGPSAWTRRFCSTTSPPPASIP